MPCCMVVREDAFDLNARCYQFCVNAYMMMLMMMMCRLLS